MRSDIVSMSTAVFEPGEAAEDQTVVPLLREHGKDPTGLVPAPIVLAAAIKSLVCAGWVKTVADVWDFIGEQYPNLNYTVILVDRIPEVFTATQPMVVISINTSCPGELLVLDRRHN